MSRGGHPERNGGTEDAGRCRRFRNPMPASGRNRRRPNPRNFRPERGLGSGRNDGLGTRNVYPEPFRNRLPETYRLTCGVPGVVPGPM
ncbi:hypothetical protein CVV72_40885 (plasmid) [Amycolatopsis sp. TNS106]|nr:hypothetical protein CVV72_40885 [Amycolatopsis sp. TNS106]